MDILNGRLKRETETKIERWKKELGSGSKWSMVNFRRDKHEALASFRAGRNRNKPTGGVSFLFSVSLYQKLSQVTHQPYEPKGRENVRKRKEEENERKNEWKRNGSKEERKRNISITTLPKKKKKKKEKNSHRKIETARNFENLRICLFFFFFISSLNFHNTLKFNTFTSL